MMGIWVVWKNGVYLIPNTEKTYYHLLLEIKQEVKLNAYRDLHDARIFTRHTTRATG